jgi:hypothetical protein
MGLPRLPLLKKYDELYNILYCISSFANPVLTPISTLNIGQPLHRGKGRKEGENGRRGRHGEGEREGREGKEEVKKGEGKGYCVAKTQIIWLSNLLMLSYLMNVIPETFMCTKFDIYVFITSF